MLPLKCPPPKFRDLAPPLLSIPIFHSGQVLSSFKCYFKRKYLNQIDSNCEVEESCPWFFIGTAVATGPECIINIYAILGRRNLFEMGAVRSARESRSVALVWRLGILVTARGFVHMGNNDSVKRIAAALRGVCFFWGFFLCILYNIITIQYNLILSIRVL